MLKRVMLIMIAFVLIFTGTVYPVFAAQSINKSIVEIKDLFGKFLDRLEDMELEERALGYDQLRFLMSSEGGIDLLSQVIRDGSQFKAALESIERNGISKDTVADAVLLFKIWDEATRLEYIDKFEDREMQSPIDEEIELYEEITSQFGDLEGMMSDHNVDLGTLILAASAIKIANDDEPIFTDDADNAENFALKAVSSRIINQIDDVLEGYTINGIRYTSFNEIASVYIDKINGKYSAERKALLKDILETRGLYEARETSTGSSGGGSGGTAADQPSTPEQAIVDGGKAIDNVLKDTVNNKDAASAVRDAIEKAVTEAAKVAVDAQDVKVTGSKATVEVKADSVKSAIENAVKVAEQLLQKAKDANVNVKAEKVVTISIPSDSIANVKEVAAKLPANIMEIAKTSGIDRIAVDTGIATVSFTPDALKNNLKEGSANIELSVAKVDKSDLTAEVAAQVGNKPVFDFNLSVDGNKVSQFNGKSAVKVSVPYTLAAGEDADKVVVYYINDAGRLEVVKNCKYDAATGKVTFATNHFSKYTIMQTNVTFGDINSSWAKTFIEALAGREMINGVGGNSFTPDAEVTREQFAKMLVEAFDLVDETAATEMTDVAKDQWYYVYVASAQKAGVVNGIGNGQFGIGAKISRQDMATMAYRAAVAADARVKKTKDLEQFGDNASIASYASDAVATMQQADIINGVGNNKFAPADTATRAQAAKIIYLLYKAK